MNNAELLAIQPAEYLKNGFYDQDGELIEGLNGEYSLAMAYRLREEQADIDQLKNIVDRLTEIASKRDSAVNDNPHLPLDAANAAAFKAVRTKTALPTVIAIFDAADPWVKDWKSYASLTLHLQRILSQLALIRNLPEKE
jgi:hypothetical protein